MNNDEFKSWKVEKLEGNKNNKELENLRSQEPKIYNLEHNGKKFNIGVKGDYVNLQGLEPRMKDFLIELEERTGVQGSELGFDVLVTSARDSEHSKNSEHYIGGAVDLRIPAEYRKSRADVYKAPIVKYFDSEDGQSFLKKYGMRSIDPIHITLGTEKKTVQNAHMHIEFLDEGEKQFRLPKDTEVPNSSVTQQVTETVQKLEEPVSKSKEASFPESLMWEMFMENTETPKKESNPVKAVSKQNILNQMQNLQKFTEFKESSDFEPIEQVQGFQPAINQISGLSEIPTNLIFKS